MGYDVDRFTCIVNEGLLCCICRDVLEDPVQAPCEHAYCRSCIEGWLVHETRCPEDRKPLSPSGLKPLFRYMKNDLEKLQIKCVNTLLGCSHVANLEFIESHEVDCQFGTIECPNERCKVTITRRDLQDHLNSCKFQTKECPHGCGMLMVIPEDGGHNCIAELRMSNDILRSELTTRLDEQRKEMELRLNMQRGHMVQKQAGMQTQIDELKSEISKVSQKMKLLMDLEMQRRQDVERLELEKKELMELLKGNLRESTGEGSKPSQGSKTTQSSRGKVTTL